MVRLFVPVTFFICIVGKASAVCCSIGVKLDSYVSEIARSNDKVALLSIKDEVFDDSIVFSWIESRVKWWAFEDFVLGVDHTSYDLTKILVDRNVDSVEKYLLASKGIYFDGDVNYSNVVSDADMRTMMGSFRFTCNFQVKTGVDYISPLYVNAGEREISQEVHCKKYWPSLFAALGLTLDVKKDTDGSYYINIQKYDISRKDKLILNDWGSRANKPSNGLL